MHKEGNPLYETPTEIAITAKDSLVHVGSLDSFDITKGGIKAGKLLLSYFENGDKKQLHKAIEIYEKIIPDENFGGEYGPVGLEVATALYNAKESGHSVSFPKCSPDGKYILYTISDCGTFPIWHRNRRTS